MPNHYMVSWEIDIWADSPPEAATKALEIQRDPFSVATMFSVTEVRNLDIDLDDYRYKVVSRPCHNGAWKMEKVTYFTTLAECELHRDLLTRANDPRGFTNGFGVEVEIWHDDNENWTVSPSREWTMLHRDSKFSLTPGDRTLQYLHEWNKTPDPADISDE